MFKNGDRVRRINTDWLTSYGVIKIGDEGTVVSVRGVGAPYVVWDNMTTRSIGMKPENIQLIEMTVEDRLMRKLKDVEYHSN